VSNALSRITTHGDFCTRGADWSKALNVLEELTNKHKA
jgi:hypothetical protein